MEKQGKGKTALGRVEVAKKALRIQDLSDKVGYAIQTFEAAQKKFETGQDSYREWQNIVKLLNIQIKDVQHFLAIAHHNLGIIHAGRKDFNKAEELFLKALEIDPDYAMAHYNLAVVYKKLDLPDKAKQYYQKAKELGYPPSA
ncbi:MAG TPA: tetratricopeptide repeat protein [bacterium]|nr:tetratricopeptide repeat protein [bacterium]